MTWFLYLLECNNGAYYAGITNNVESRFLAHLSGKGAKYTRANPPIRILAFKAYPDRSSASSAEAKLKKRKRELKLSFFESDTN
jgi:putative endonuclease